MVHVRPLSEGLSSSETATRYSSNVKSGKGPSDFPARTR
uniref:Uncharacterized protein n=2 Tax=Ciona intestinalis TaxID=7719 RepID=F6XWB9_CIOIN